jgi:hypothetical protein
VRFIASSPSDKERKAAGRALRDKIKRGDLGCWRPKEDRADPVDLIEEGHAGRLERLVPVRVGRMVTSPYAFLRGSASLMTEDFAGIPRTGIEPVICGDAQLVILVSMLHRSVTWCSTSMTLTRHTRPVGMGPLAADYEYLGGRSAKRPCRKDLRRCRPVVCNGLPPANSWSRRSASAGPLVQPDGY